MGFYDANGRNCTNTSRIERFSGVLLLVTLCFLLTACDLAAPSSPLTTSQSSTPDAVATASVSGDATRLTVVTVAPDPSLFLDAPTSYSYSELREDGPETLDPIFAWDPGSQTVIRNVLETLAYPHPQEADSYIPLLSTGWRISNEGRTYTFSIRRDVRFSNGNTLSASDVSYSLQRLLLASPPGGPQHLLLEPLLGISTTHVITTSPGLITPTVTAAPGNATPVPTIPAPLTDQSEAIDITSALENGPYTGDRAALIANESANTLLALCQELQTAIVASDGDGALTINLRHPWAPLLSVLSQTWTSVVDRQWAVERGAWDGRCETWQDWYALDAAESSLATAILGTGPYTLDYWSPGAGYVLLANPDYWRGDSPMWAGGPSGPPALPDIQVRQVADANQRWQLLEDGSAHSATLSRAGSLLADRQTGLVCIWSGDCQETNSPVAPLRRVEDIPVNRRQALIFNYAIPVAENAFVGSGQLDGDGIPSDFFSDGHVRRAFAYCLDQRAFIQAGLGGEGLRVTGLFPSFIGAVPQTDSFPYLLRRCNDELALAWDGQLPETGFRLQVPFESGNAAQQAIAVLLQNSLRAVNPAYRLEPIGLPAPLMHQTVGERRAPLTLLSWTPQLPDAYYWVAPAFEAEIAAFQQLPPHLDAASRDFLARLREADLSSRPQIYADLNQFYEQSAPFILLPEPSTTLYQRRHLDQWLFNPADPLPYFYAFR